MSFKRKMERSGKSADQKRYEGLRKQYEHDRKRMDAAPPDPELSPEDAEAVAHEVNEVMQGVEQAFGHSGRRNRGR